MLYIHQNNLEIYLCENIFCSIQIKSLLSIGKIKIKKGLAERYGRGHDIFPKSVLFTEFGLLYFPAAYST